MNKTTLLTSTHSARAFQVVVPDSTQPSTKVGTVAPANPQQTSTPPPVAPSDRYAKDAQPAGASLGEDGRGASVQGRAQAARMAGKAAGSSEALFRRFLHQGNLGGAAVPGKTPIPETPSTPTWAAPPATLDLRSMPPVPGRVHTLDVEDAPLLFQYLKEQPYGLVEFTLAGTPCGVDDFLAVKTDANGRMFVEPEPGRPVEIPDQATFMDLARDLANDGTVTFLVGKPFPPGWANHLQPVDASALPSAAPGSKGLQRGSSSLDAVLTACWQQRDRLVKDGSFEWYSLLNRASPPVDTAAYAHAVRGLWDEAVARDLAPSYQDNVHTDAGYTHFTRRTSSDYAFQVLVDVDPAHMAEVSRKLMDVTASNVHVRGFKVAGTANIHLASNVFVYPADEQGLRAVLDALSSFQRHHPECFGNGGLPLSEEVAPGICYMQRPNMADRKDLAGNTGMTFMGLTGAQVRKDAIQQALMETVAAGGDETRFRARAAEILAEHNVNPAAPHLNLYTRSSGPS